jgi:hypothetical protein
MNTNPEKAQRNLNRYLGNIQLLKSTRKNKKYMVQTPNGTYTHFGDSRYDDFTVHGDKERQQRYLARATKIKGSWKNNPYSANNLSIHTLWM